MRREELVKLEKLKPGEFYSQAKVDGDENRIKTAIGYRGVDAATHEQITYRPETPNSTSCTRSRKSHRRRSARSIIVGNDVTRENVIRRQIPLYPGQILTYPDIRATETNLRPLNIFENNPETGVKPTVKVLDRDSNGEYKDILVRVQETHHRQPDVRRRRQLRRRPDRQHRAQRAQLRHHAAADQLRRPAQRPRLARRRPGVPHRGRARHPAAALHRQLRASRSCSTARTAWASAATTTTASYNEYTEERVGTRVTLGRQLNQHWTDLGGIRVEDVGVHNVPAWRPAEYHELSRGTTSWSACGPASRATRATRSCGRRRAAWSTSPIEECLGELHLPALQPRSQQVLHHLPAGRRQRPAGAGGPQSVPVAGSRHARSTSASTPAVSAACAASSSAASAPTSMASRSAATSCCSTAWNTRSRSWPTTRSTWWALSIPARWKAAWSSKTTACRPAVGLRIVVPMLGPVPIALDFGFPIVKAPTDNKQVFSFWVGFFH